MTPLIETRDRTSLFYKDWGTGKPVVFIHGWALGADIWEYQMPYLISRGLRCIAYDKRGCGRSSQPWDGYDFDTFADDLAALIEHLDLRGDADQGAPLELTGRKTAQSIPRSQLKVYEGAAHGLFITEKDRLNADLLAFIQSEPHEAKP